MMEIIKNLRISFIIIVFLIFNLICVSISNVDATARTGDIEIDYEGRSDTRDDILLEGATFVIYPIQYKEDNQFVWRDEFSKCGISLEDDSAGAREEQAKKLYEYALKNDIHGIIHKTDKSGHTSFLDLAEGLYLLAEVGSVMNEGDEFASAPFLVSIPSEVSGKFDYEVDIEPKAEWVSHDGEPVGPHENPKDDPKQDEPKDDPKDESKEEPGKDSNELKKDDQKIDKENQLGNEKNVENNPIERLINIVKTGDQMQGFTWFTILIISGLLIFILQKKDKFK